MYWLDSSCICLLFLFLVQFENLYIKGGAYVNICLVEQKKQIIAEVKAGLDDADTLVWH